MKYRKVWRDYSWFGILNQLLLQWFFVRLQVACDSDDPELNIIRLDLIAPVVPLTGWWSDYIPQRHATICIWRKR